MHFIWNEQNTAHLAAHGVTPEIAEAVFYAGLSDMRPSSIRHRYILEAEVDGRAYRLICDISRDSAVFPVTSYPL